MEKKIKVLIVAPCDITVPAVKGGAFATRVENIVKCNEEMQKMQLTVISRYEKTAVERAARYPSTQFLYVNYDSSEEERYHCSKWVRWINYVGYKLFGVMIITSPNMRKEFNLIKHEEFDVVFAAGGELEQYSDFTRKFGRDRMVFNVGGHLQINNIAVNTFAHYVCCSEYIKDYINNDISDKLRTKINVVSILNRIDVGLFGQELQSDEISELKRKYELDDKFIYLFMGRISPEKGLEELIDAFNGITNKQKSVLLIVGSVNFGLSGTSDFENKIIQKVKDSRNVKLLGYIHHDQLWKILKLADVAVLPSTWEEPAGNVVPETMAAGLPIIITRSGGMIEYVDESCSLVVENDDYLVEHLKDAMEYIYKNSEKRESLGHSAKIKSCEYDIHTYYDMLYKHFTKINEKLL